MELSAAIVRHFLLLVALLAPLELLLPAQKNQRPLRRGSLTDLVHFTLNPFLISTGAAFLLALLASLIERVVPGRAILRAQPWGLQLAEIFVAAELLGYWVHRLSHDVPWLWRFHAVHHSNTSLDFLATHRQHPLEAVWLAGVANLPVLMLGFDVDAIATFILAQKLYTAFLHANVRVGFGRFTVLLASPQFHHWHHDAHTRGNFASALPWIDRLFGTYRLPDGFPKTYGCDEPVPTGWPGQLLHPFAARSPAPSRAPAARASASPPRAAEFR
jgi:sterol desaturase/sphingolipid hydroxylase (fatty acid hydroxylase superfamily)